MRFDALDDAVQATSPVSAALARRAHRLQPARAHGQQRATRLWAFSVQRFGVHDRGRERRLRIAAGHIDRQQFRSSTA